MNNLKVTFKILILVVIAVIGMTITGIRGVQSISQGGESLEYLYENELQAISHVGRLIEKMRVIQVRSMQAIADPGRADEVAKSQAQDIKEFDELWNEYYKLCQDPEEKAEADAAYALWQKFKVSVPAVIPAVKAGGATAGTAEYNKAGKDDTVKLRNALNKLQEESVEDAEKVNIQNKADNSNAIQVMVLTSIVCLLLQLIVSFFIIREIKNPLNNMVEECRKLHRGEFKVNGEASTRGDEFGDVERALYEMTKSVNKFLNDVANSTEQIASASEELTASSMQSAMAATSVAQSVTGAAEIVVEQQTAVDNGSTGVRSITESVESVNEESKKIAGNAQDAAAKAHNGSKAVTKSVEQIHSVEETVQSTALLVDKLGERSQEIGAIVDTISNLAGQTNLLALNAAIEAARAGEQGRGFAVVAEEVRKLAEQSGDAANHIAELISAIQNDTAKAVKSMTEGREAVDIGAKSVEGLSQVFDEINELIAQVSDRIQAMSESVALVAKQAEGITGEMSSIDSGAQRVAEEMQSVSAATQQQSASAEEIASSSDALAKLAQEVKDVLGRFKF